MNEHIAESLPQTPRPRRACYVFADPRCPKGRHARVNGMLFVHPDDLDFINDRLRKEGWEPLPAPANRQTRRVVDRWLAAGKKRFDKAQARRRP